MMVKLGEIKDIKILINNKNKKSSYGENLYTTLNMFFKFLNIYFKVILFNLKK